MSEWISVKDQLPEPGTTVLAAFNGQFQWVMFTARCTPDIGLTAAGYASPTHWMPLPPPPEEKAMSRPSAGLALITVLLALCGMASGQSDNKILICDHTGINCYMGSAPIIMVLGEDCFESGWDKGMTYCRLPKGVPLLQWAPRPKCEDAFTTEQIFEWCPELMTAEPPKQETPHEPPLTDEEIKELRHLLFCRKTACFEEFP
jgi:hypothetical protein